MLANTQNTHLLCVKEDTHTNIDMPVHFLRLMQIQGKSSLALSGKLLRRNMLPLSFGFVNANKVSSNKCLLF